VEGEAVARWIVSAEGVEAGTGRTKACVVAKKARRRKAGRRASSRVLLNMMPWCGGGAEGVGRSATGTSIDMRTATTEGLKAQAAQQDA